MADLPKDWIEVAKRELKGRDPAELAKTAAAERITVLQVVPALLQTLLATAGFARVLSRRSTGSTKQGSTRPDCSVRATY